jgi:TonB family protein
MIAGLLLLSMQAVALPQDIPPIESVEPIEPMEKVPPPMPFIDRPAGELSRVLQPLADPISWVTFDDYPSAAEREGREGLVAMSLVVGSDGVPVTCGIRISSGSDDLDQAACRTHLQRARFQPALDSDGLATIAIYRRNVRWLLREPDPTGRSTRGAVAARSTNKPWIGVPPAGTELAVPAAFPVQLSQRTELASPDELRRLVNSAPASFYMFRIQVRANGEVASCEPIGAARIDALNRLICSRYRQRAVFRAASDDSGTPMNSWVYVGWAVGELQIRDSIGPRILPLE